jgi:CDP-diacylglycerol--serine O-phosphatidyltransferase
MMNALQRPGHRRQGVRRAVVLMPNGLTLFNLFCGIYAIILAIRGDFGAAPGFIVLGGIADTLDGRVARATGTGSRFGEELDSLVDAISFGFAPALIVYLGLPNRGTWEWLLVFIFTSCAVMRLARFNVEQAGRKKTHFHGLPSPAAGLTLATYYWFSQTPLYNQAVILFTDSKTLSDLPWPTIMRGLMAILAALMISDVPYPTVPQIGFRSVRKIIGTIVVLGSVLLVLFRKEEFLFPALLAYVLYGVIKWVIVGFLGRSSTPDEIFGVDKDRTARRFPSLRRAPSNETTPMDPIAEEDLLIQHGVDLPDEPEDEDEPKEPRRVQRDEPRRPPQEGGQAPKRKRRKRGRGGNRPHGSIPPGPPLPDSPTGPAE